MYRDAEAVRQGGERAVDDTEHSRTKAVAETRRGEKCKYVSTTSVACAPPLIRYEPNSLRMFIAYELRRRRASRAKLIKPYKAFLIEAAEHL